MRNTYGIRGVEVQMAIKISGPVATLSEYLDSVKSLASAWKSEEEVDRRGDERDLWFRGQKFAEWGLSPQLYREPYQGAAEDEIRQEFQSQAIQLIQGRQPDTKWEWYFLMQHHRIPTRLLDWTGNPLVALYFAVDNHPGNSDAAVWVLDPWWLNAKLRMGISGPMLCDWSEAERYLNDLEDSFAGKKITVQLPAAIDPPHVDRRLAAQKSRFVVFGKTKDMTRTKAARSTGARLAKIVIKRKSVNAIAGELPNSGVTAFSIFPDLEGLCEEVRQRWKRTAEKPTRR